MARHHLIISGTGRAGTTFLMQLFTKLGLDTGFNDASSGVLANCNAGMEHDIRRKNAPYLIKSPHLCDQLDAILAGGDIVIDHTFVPIRDLFSAAESRRAVMRRSDPALGLEATPGGLWKTTTPKKQEAVLTAQFYKLFHALAKHDVPTTLLYFPRFIHEPAYLYKKLGGALKPIDYPAFLQVFKTVARPELIHDFKPGAG